MRRSHHLACQARSSAGRPVRALVQLAILLLVGGGCAGAEGGAVAEGEATTVEAPRDTASLPSTALELGGLDTVRARRGPWHDGWSGPARLVTDPTATEALGSIVEGRVAAMRVQPGDNVRAGQVLVQLHSHEMMDARAGYSAAEAGLNRARTALTLATSAAERAERLFAARALSKADLESALARQEDARATLAQAEGEMTRAADFLEHLLGEGPTSADIDPHHVLVRAPFDGVVIARQAEPGAVVTVGAPLVTVSRTTGLVLVARIPETAAGQAREGSTIHFVVAAYPDRRFSARVTRVSPAVDTATRSIELRASVPSAGVLRPEMFATAELMGPPSDSALAVPAEAIQAFEGDTVVVTYQSRDDGAFLEAVPVKVGRRSGGMVEILSGLDDEVLVVGQGASVARAELLRRRSAGEVQ